METTLKEAIPGKGLVQFMREIDEPVIKDEEGEVVGNYEVFPVDKTNTLRNQVSGRLKFEFPDRKYSVSNQGTRTIVYWERRSA
ncbi:hypothetical protein [Pedobacter agri]|uniref:Uncharacterized protein n=1 Tax=Pedobacter agri TaxID=454586 RepID=A0A9X3DI50_9SPHI|nr:hypothetical protein [Pedobacter agri]MCX3266586.1 hypothetical protein [Pedobacter agri]